MKSISNAAFPMKALGKIEVAGVEFQPGQEFDALTSESHEYLVKHGAAADLDPTSAGTQAAAPAAKGAEQPAPKEPPADQGTANVIQHTEPGK